MCPSMEATSSGVKLSLSRASTSAPLEGSLAKYDEFLSYVSRANLAEAGCREHDRPFLDNFIRKSLINITGLQPLCIMKAFALTLSLSYHVIKNKIYGQKKFPHKQ